MSERALKEGRASERLHFNGIDGVTGEYLFPPVALEDLYPVIRNRELAPVLTDLRLLEESRRWTHLNGTDWMGVRDDIDPNSLGEAGWGVVLPAVASGDTQGFKAQEALLEALKPLLDHRRSLAGKFFKVFAGSGGHRPKESARGWLARHGAPADLPVDPMRGVPYYLLLVGSPEEISFQFQYELDVEYAVGRIHFDTLEEYAHYARSIVEAERGPAFLPRRMALFGTENSGDIATHLSRIGLVQPVQAQLSSISAPWTVEAYLGEDATKACLARLLGGSQTPALLFTASHGMGFRDIDDTRLEPFTGALICQDWPGPGQVATPDHALAAEDIGSEAQLLGMVAFFFACYGAGIPAYEDFPTNPMRPQGAPQRISHRPFLSRLPRRLLGHARGGALAVIGHVERAWACSFSTHALGQGADLFADGLKRLMRGQTVGHAMELFNNRFSRNTVEISEMLAATQWGGPLRCSGERVTQQQLVENWIATHDARNYVILGDPAVRLRFADISSQQP